jgi:hypothetical protein
MRRLALIGAALAAIIVGGLLAKPRHPRLQKLPIPVLVLVSAEAPPADDEFPPPPCPTGPVRDAFLRSWCPNPFDDERPLPPPTRRGAWRERPPPKRATIPECEGRDCTAL